MNDISIRPIENGDARRIKRLLEGIVEFKPEEIDCALELAGEALKNGNSEKEYALYCAEDHRGELVGFVCYGETPLARAVYDLYWIATEPRCRRRGVARGLMGYLEAVLDRRGARMLVAETSSLPAYEKARAFYTRLGFREESRIKDFYAPGDDRVIYCKRFH